MGRSSAGELVCAVCLGFESRPLEYGLKLREAIYGVLDRWPGGPKKPERVPEHWHTDWAHGPGPGYLESGKDRSGP